jgi:hypothetical protein
MRCIILLIGLFAFSSLSAQTAPIPENAAELLLADWELIKVEDAGGDVVKKQEPELRDRLIFMEAGQVTIVKNGLDANGMYKLNLPESKVTIFDAQTETTVEFVIENIGTDELQLRYMVEEQVESLRRLYYTPRRR